MTSLTLHGEIFVMRLSLVLPAFAALLLTLAPTSSHAIVVSISTPVTDGTDGNDGTDDYWGIVNAGVTIGGLAVPFQSSVGPSVGDLAGKDMDAAPTSFNGFRTATWSLTLPAGTVSVDSIDFSGTLAAKSGQFFGWNGSAGLRYQLKVAGLIVLTHEYTPVSPMDEKLGLAGLMPFVTEAGIPVNLTHAGQAGAPSIELFLTAHSTANDAEFWTNGTLSANAVLPEPSTGPLVLLASLLIGFLHRTRQAAGRAQQGA